MILNLIDMNYTFDEYIAILKNCDTVAEIDNVRNFMDRETFSLKEIMVLRGVVNLRKQIINGKIS